MFPQPHTVTIRTAANGTDSRGDDTQTFTDTTVRGWIQQGGQSETLGDRDQRRSGWTLFSTETPGLSSTDRVTWNGKTFTCDGEPNHLWNAVAYHHTEAALSLVEG